MYAVAISRYFEAMRFLLRNVAGCIFCVAFAAAGQSVPPPHLVRASGEASLKVKPDHAQIRIGVTSQSPTAQGAAQANARETAHVVEVLKSALGSSGELKTTGYSISPQYQYGNNTPPKLTGYRANNTVLVEINDIAKAGELIDAAVKAGANDVNGISFTVRNDQAVREQAIAQAAVKARANAEAIAKALGLKVVSVFEAASGSSISDPIRPMPMMARAMAAPAPEPTPVEAGTLDIRATVTVALIVE